MEYSNEFMVRLKDEVSADEGVVLEVYLDHLGYPTVGVGHLILESDPEYGEGTGFKINQTRCDELFYQDIRNVLNDNYTYFYVKKADASRIYGLELEHILSPHNLNFLVYKDTLIEEHISGIPGDDFIKEFLPKCSESEKSQIAKEFVKFKERCLVRLLGDMRSYNYVIIPTHDFDKIIYKIRAIDFDQQSFEGNLKVYDLQFLKENFKIVDMVSRKLDNNSIMQYKLEERSFMAKRMITSPRRASRLIKCMKNDTLSFPDNVQLLKKHLIKYVGDVKFKECTNMGEILETILVFVKRNYQDVLTK